MLEGGVADLGGAGMVEDQASVSGIMKLDIFQQGAAASIDSDVSPVSGSGGIFCRGEDDRSALGALGVEDSIDGQPSFCLLYTSPSPRDVEESRMPSSA